MRIWLLALACTTPASPAEDAKIFAQVLADPKAPGAMAACAEIVDPNSQGECQLKVALNQADQGAACAQVGTELYRDECFFMASEAARRRRDTPSAVVLCRDSGRFIEDCQQHLWQGDLRAVMGRSGSFAVRYGQAKEIFCVWSEELGHTPGFEDRFWEKGWNTVIAQQPVLDIAGCSELNPTQTERCQKAGAHLLAARLDEVMVQPDARRTLCDGGLPSLDMLRYTPDPVLDAVLERHRDAVCVQGLERPEGRDAPETSPDPDKVEPERCP